jgi:hypothetical protein
VTDNLFSRRHGLQKEPELQIQSMNTNLRTALWNVLLARVFGKLACNYDGDITQEYHVFIALQKHFFRLPMDELERQLASRREWYKDVFSTMEWWQVYDFFEFIARRMIPYDLQEFERDTNDALARENAGYLLVGGSVVPIADDVASESIRQTLHHLRCFRDIEWIQTSETSLKESLSALAQRPKPDLQSAALKASESLSGLLAQLPEARESDTESTDLWRGLRSPGLNLPTWMTQAVTSAWQSPPTDAEEAWALVTLAASTLRLLLTRAMARGWIPQREIQAPEASAPDPWGERHIVRPR